VASRSRFRRSACSWSFTQTTSAGGNIEVFDLGVAGGVPVAAGFYESLACGARGWIATFAP